MEYPINNITFELYETHQEFSFTKSYASNEWCSACLQLPDTADSQNSIDGVEEQDWNDEEREICQQLKRFFFDSFNDVECAAASALLAKEIIHVEEVGDFYVAFTCDESFLIKESWCRSYYNKAALFDHVYDFYDVDSEALLSKAKKAFFESLDRKLTADMQKVLDEATSPDEAWIGAAFDEILHEFMKSNFSDDYDSCDIASEFYEFYGCDTRIDFEREAREKMEQMNHPKKVVVSLEDGTCGFLYVNGSLFIDADRDPESFCGQLVEVELNDENGNRISARGVVVEILSVEEV